MPIIIWNDTNNRASTPTVSNRLSGKTLGSALQGHQRSLGKKILKTHGVAEANDTGALVFVCHLMLLPEEAPLLLRLNGEASLLSSKLP